MEVKSIEKTQKEFMANGHKYFLVDKIPVSRFKEYEKLVPRLTFGIGFDEIFSSLKKAYSSLNTPQPKPLDAGIIIHNLMNGIADVNNSKRVHPALMMAALVINREGEDATKYDEQTMLDKVNDWTVEGLDMMSFFDLSLTSIHGFRETLVKYTQTQAEMLIKGEDKKAKV